jgi:vanillate monooxygenase ferredoxin subunit
MSLQLQVIRKTQEAIDICVIDLASHDRKNLPAFTAGSHIDVHLPNGIIRQYSLCNDPNETHRYQIAVLKDPASRGGSQALHDSIHEGQILQVSAPKNHFVLDHKAKKSLLLAGGIGITPLICMAEALARTGAEFELHYCARTPDHTAFRKRIMDSNFANRTLFYFSKDKNSQKLALHKLLAQPKAGCHIYICGPKRFMDAVLATARELGWPENQLHYEFFNADVITLETDESFEVKVASSGQIVTVHKDQTITDALSAAGIDILISCEQGVCGTCLTRVLEGIPDHRDSYLTPEEQAANNQFTPCCSRAKTKQLVIDV